MPLKALAEIYTMRSFVQLCNLNFLSKIEIADADANEDEDEGEEE